MHDVSCKRLTCFKNTYVNKQGYVTVKSDGSESFRIYNGVKQECIIPTWLFKMYTDGVMKEVKI